MHVVLQDLTPTCSGSIQMDASFHLLRVETVVHLGQ